MLANVRQADGIAFRLRGKRGQYDEVFLAYPELAALARQPLSPHTVLDPGQSVEGTVFWVFRLTRQEWEARKDWPPDPKHSDPGSKSGLNFTFSSGTSKPGARAPHRGYGTVAGAGALLGVDR